METIEGVVKDLNRKNGHYGIIIENNNGQYRFQVSKFWFKKIKLNDILKVKGSVDLIPAAGSCSFFYVNGAEIIAVYNSERCISTWQPCQSDQPVGAENKPSWTFSFPEKIEPFVMTGLTPEKSAFIQEALFSNRIFWKSGDDTVKDLTSFRVEDGVIYSDFVEAASSILSYEDFLILYWIPCVGDLVNYVGDLYTIEDVGKYKYTKMVSMKKEGLLALTVVFRENISPYLGEKRELKLEPYQKDFLEKESKLLKNLDSKNYTPEEVASITISTLKEAFGATVKEGIPPAKEFPNNGPAKEAENLIKAFTKDLEESAQPLLDKINQIADQLKEKEVYAISEETLSRLSQLLIDNMFGEKQLIEAVEILAPLGSRGLYPIETLKACFSDEFDRFLDPELIRVIRLSMTGVRPLSRVDIRDCIVHAVEHGLPFSKVKTAEDLIMNEKIGTLEELQEALFGSIKLSENEGSMSIERYPNGVVEIKNKNSSIRIDEHDARKLLKAVL
jgi:hypothetical protein